MATYNTFVVVDCKKRTPTLVTSSARKARSVLTTGFRIEVWNDNKKVNTIYYKNQSRLGQYITLEKEYIRQKQEKATKRRAKRIEQSSHIF
jgi:hypothetical protein